MNRSVVVTAGIAVFLHMSAAIPATADNIQYGPPAPWVTPTPAVTPSNLATDAPIRFDYLDNQVHITSDGTDEQYTAYRVKIMKPEGLAAGNLSLTWQPDTGAMTVHYVHLIRNGQTTDILASTRFTILQREAYLEQSVLTGQRTATLQVPGLQVGDEIELAATIDKRDAGLDGRVAGLFQFPIAGTPGTFRNRLTWPAGRALGWRMSQDMPRIAPTTAGGQTTLEVTLRDPSGAIPTEGALRATTSVG